MNFVDRAAQFTPRHALAQSLADPQCGGFIVSTPFFGGDEFGLIDDPVDFLVLARELQERLQRGMFAIEGRIRVGDNRGDMIADPSRHVEHQRTEQRILRFEPRIK